VGLNDTTDPSPALPGAAPPTAADGLDLRPRTDAVPAAPRRRAVRSRAQRIRMGALGLVALAGVGFVVSQGLSNSALYFCNADEVGRRPECMPEGRFRLQGAVVPGSVTQVGAGEVDFRVAYNGATVAVRHFGSPPDLFQEDIPVVLEGQMAGATFESTRIMVKHSEQYKAANPDRVAPGAP
jgi:cytochrome c-type biogenesis protein CcmE